MSSPPPTEISQSAPAKIAQGEKKLSDEELYAIVDEAYGYPIANLESKSFIAGLRSQGFQGPEPKLHPDGMPGIPEAKVMQSWYLTRELDPVTLEVDVIGDHRGAVRNVQFILVSKDGKAVTDRAREFLPPLSNLINRPAVTSWFLTHSGKKHVEDLGGAILESTGGSQQFWMYNIKGAMGEFLAAAPMGDTITDPNATRPDDYRAMREWSDSSGTFKVMASFVSLGNGHVKLKKEDGKIIDVPMEKLSILDQTFVNKLKHN